MRGLQLILFFFVLTISFGQSSPTTRILFILDASNSMNSSWGSQTRIQAAREVLNQELEMLRGVPNTEVALRVYGHQTPYSNLTQDCNDTKLEVPFGVNNIDQIKMKINTIEAKGATPIARSLEASAGDFPDTISRNIIILITDGLESCDNDPCVIAKKLKEKGVKVTPFVIGLGMDMSYLDKFNCIGSYTDAEDKESFRNVFKNILNTVLVKTTVQVNLNDIKGKPSETNVTLFFYEAGSTKLKYTFVHTLNRLGNPDTLFLDPSLNYDLMVNTIPSIYKSNITLKKYVHNTISVSAPQGMLKLTTPNSIYAQSVAMVLSAADEPKTIHHQLMGEINKYLVGTYDVEILTLPRIYKTVEVTQSNLETILIEAPGQLDFTFEKPMIAQLFVKTNAKELVWVYNFSDRVNTGQLLLQPGSYSIIYRNKEMKSSGYTREKTFTISSNKTNSIKLN